MMQKEFDNLYFTARTQIYELIRSSNKHFKNKKKREKRARGGKGANCDGSILPIHYFKCRQFKHFQAQARDILRVIS